MTKNLFIIVKTWIPDYLITAGMVLLSAFVFSCHEPDEAPVSLKWVPSEFTRYGSGFFSFRTGDDNSLYSVGFVDNEFGVHDHIIAIGDNSTTGISISYFFNGNDWIPISTTNYFFGVFKHNGRIFGYTGDGIIVELVYG